MSGAEVTTSLSNVIKKDSSGFMESKKVAIRLLKLNQRKAETYETDHTNAARHYISQAKAEAEQIIRQANMEAIKIKEKIAKKRKAFDIEKQQIMEQAQREGYEKGIEIGRNEGYKKVSEQIQLAKDIVESAKQEYRQCVEKSEQTILHLALKVAEKILHTTLERNQEHFMPIVQKAVEEAKDYKKAQIYVHPSNYPFLVEHKEELAPFFQNGEIYIYPDETLPGSGCIIETDGITIDAGVDTQLEEIKKQLYDIFSGDSE